MYFKTIIDFYQKFIPENIKPGLTFGTVFLETFSQMVEPYEIKWFPKMCTGKVIIGLWSLYALFLVLFYLSVFRSHLIAPEREDPINTSQDVLARGQPIHMLHSAIPNVKRSLINQQDTRRRYSLSYPKKIQGPFNQSCYDIAREGGMRGFCPGQIAVEGLNYMENSTSIISSHSCLIAFLKTSS